MMNLFQMEKSVLKRFGFIKPSSELYDGENIVAWTTMGVFIITEVEKVYTEKDHKKERWLNDYYSLSLSIYIYVYIYIRLWFLLRPVFNFLLLLNLTLFSYCERSFAFPHKTRSFGVDQNWTKNISLGRK